MTVLINAAGRELLFSLRLSSLLQPQTSGHLRGILVNKQFLALECQAWGVARGRCLLEAYEGRVIGSLSPREGEGSVKSNALVGVFLNRPFCWRDDDSSVIVGCTRIAESVGKPSQHVRLQAAETSGTHR